jgi:T5SS/PEP-CTERM-associated repeat protein
LNLTGGTVVTVDNTGSGFSFVDIGRSAAGGDATVSGGSSLVVKATGTGTSSITIGRNVNAVGTMTVTGAGSSVTVEDVLSVGRDGGTGTLNVENSPPSPIPPAAVSPASAAAAAPEPST